MALVVYILCGLTSLICAGLLFRAYRSKRSALLLWSSLCFIGFAVSNILLFIDLVIIPTGVDLSPVRSLVGLASVSILLYGLVWDTV